MIRACNDDLRSVLIEAGHRLKCCDALWSALAQHRTGDTGNAIETQKRALYMIPAEYHQQRKKFEERLAEYEAALPENNP